MRPTIGAAALAALLVSLVAGGQAQTDDKNVVKQMDIKVSGKVGDLVQVSAVKPGDKVVLSPSEKLKDGGTVAIQKK